MGILAFIVFGLIVGLIARALMPGRQSMGLFATTLIGIAGSFVGGFLSSLLFGGNPFQLHASGIVGSVIGALLVLIVLLFVGGRRQAAV